MEKLELMVGNVTGEDNELTLRQGQAKKIYDYNGFRYKAFSTESFIKLVNSKGEIGSAIVAYDDSGIKAILDDLVVDRDQDIVEYDFRFSQQFLEWKGILNGARLNQQDFIKFLKRREPDEVIDLESLMAQLQNFKFVTNISGDFTFDDRNNYTFAMKIGEAEGTVRLPQFIFADIEIYNESGFRQSIEIELEVVIPKNEGEKVLFLLSCPKLERYKRAAMENEMGKVFKGLDGWLIVTGAI